MDIDQNLQAAKEQFKSIVARDYRVVDLFRKLFALILMYLRRSYRSWLNRQCPETLKLLVASNNFTVMLLRPQVEERPSLEMETAPSPTTSLLDIPQEVRRIIYHHLFDRARIVLPAFKCKVQARHLNLPVLQTCHKIRDEALPYLYSAIVLISTPPYDRPTKRLTIPAPYLSAVKLMVVTQCPIAYSFPSVRSFRIDPLSQCPGLRTLMVDNTMRLPVTCPLQEMQEASLCSTPSPAGEAAPKLVETVRRELAGDHGVMGRLYLAPERAFEIIVNLHINAWTEAEGIRSRNVMYVEIQVDKGILSRASRITREEQLPPDFDG